MNIKHTPGPWHAHYITACAEEADGEYVTATAITSNDEPTYKRTGGRGDLIAFIPHDRAHEANARLISAAPDLLSALKALHDYCWNNIAYFGDPVDGDAEANALDRVVDAALAKAER